MVTTKYIKSCVESCSVIEFISYWIQFYNEGKYPETVYEENLKKGGILEENNIIPLLEWKRGNPLPKTQKQIAIKVIRSLQRFNEFRLLKPRRDEDFEEFWNLISTIIKKGLVWKAFLLHIARPDDYPMVDQHVLRAYYFLIHEKVAEPEQSLETYLAYREAFHNITIESRKTAREVDKALMAFGRFLKAPFVRID